MKVAVVATMRSGYFQEAGREAKREIKDDS